MALVYIQASHGAWYILRDGEPAARRPTSREALDLALHLVQRSVEHGEEAQFAGIVNESFDSPVGSQHQGRWVPEQEFPRE